MTQEKNIANSLLNRRLIKNKIAIALSLLTMAFGLFWLIWILFTTIEEGISGLSLNALIERQPTSDAEPGEGGLGHGIIGSLLIIFGTTVIGTPIGILVGIYLSEYGKGRAGKALAYTIRFMNDILLSAPSIIIGLFIFSLFVIGRSKFGWAGVLALALIQIPIVIRTSENMLLLIPNTLREAAYALGTPRWKVILNIILKASSSGIITGVLLSVARIAGETAPLIYTSGTSQHFETDLSLPIATLPTVIYEFTKNPTDRWAELAWTGVLLITLFVLFLNILARVLFRNKKSK